MTVRNTIQRSLVLAAVRSLQCHATAEEVYSFIAREHPSIGRATVYRNLRLLSDNGDIRRLQIPGEPERFDHNTCAHHHIQCTGCGKIFDAFIPNLPDLAERIQDTHGLNITETEISFRGICSDCAGQSN